MDDTNLPRIAHEQALRGITRLNSWSRSYAGLWVSLRREAQRVAPLPLRILDIATGSGDTPIHLALRARQEKHNVSLAACDISTTALQLVKQRAARYGVAIDLFQCDVIRELIPGKYDAVMTSLFLHHLSESAAIALLKVMANVATRLVLVNDLRRSRLNLGLVTVASRLLSRSSIVHFDAPASVRAAFTMSEAQDLADKAGLVNAEVSPHFPCRWLMTWQKPT